MAETKEVTLEDVFNKIDRDGSGTLSAEELKHSLVELGWDPRDVDAILKESDSNNDGTVDRDEFNKALKKVNNKKGKVGYLARMAKAQSEIMQVKTQAGGVHTYSQEELTAFADHINSVLEGDSDLGDLLPVNIETDELFGKIHNGLLLAKFVNKIKEGTIDERVLNKPKKNKKDMHIIKKNENHTLMINACKAIGVKVENIGAGDLIEVKNPSLALGLLWQMVKMHLLSDINLKAHPELLRLLMEGETMEDLLALSPEEILKRWMNYHLAAAESQKRIKNFSGDVKDSEAYAIVMNRIGGDDKCPMHFMKKKDKTARARQVLENAKNLGCRPFIKPTDIASGNSKLNLAFVADLFNSAPGLDPLEKEELEKYGAGLDDEGDNREERVFRLWANCLGIPDFYLNYLYGDLHDGVNMLKIIDAINPGSVNWRKVAVPKADKKLMVFKKNMNNTYAISLLKGMKFSLVGIGGSDITNQNKKLMLACLWQLFRWHSIKFLSELGQDVSNDAILQMANDMVERVGGQTIGSFKDKAQSTGIYACNLVKAYKPEVWDDDLVTAGNSTEDALMNARYAISVARKHDMMVFVLPEDLIECKTKLCLTFAAAVIHKAQGAGH